MSIDVVAEPYRMTAEEFAELPTKGAPYELVDGVPVPMNMSSPRHGQICAQVTYFLKIFLAQNRVGRAVSNDSGIITQRTPDTVRGADVAFYSYDRLPADLPLPRRGYARVTPELVIEVRSYTDRWGEIQAKVGDYLRAGVRMVILLDEQTERAWLYRNDEIPVEYRRDDVWQLEPPLEGWRVTIRDIFEAN